MFNFNWKLCKGHWKVDTYGVYTRYQGFLLLGGTSWTRRLNIQGVNIGVRSNNEVYNVYTQIEDGKVDGSQRPSWDRFAAHFLLLTPANLTIAWYTYINMRYLQNSSNATKRS